MVTLILGLVLLVVPFVLMDLFSDKKKGFIYIFFFLFLFQTILAVLTQSFGLFYYKVVFGCTLFADLVLLLIYFTIRAKIKKKFSFSIAKIDWIIIAVAIISLLSLYQVHYNYTGKISLATDQGVSYHEVKNMVYSYPYFSDEWYAVSLVEGAIDNHSLPFKNVLAANVFFPNLELFFHSFIAEIILLLGLNPLLDYTILSIFLNTLIIILAYLFLRINNVSKLTAGVCSLLMLYITCGANLPGLWHLIPFNLGIMLFLASICFMKFNDTKATIASVILASLFYPPLIPFYFIGLLVFLLCRIKIPKENLLKIRTFRRSAPHHTVQGHASQEPCFAKEQLYNLKIIFRGLLFLFFAALVFCIVLMFSPWKESINYIFSKIFFVSFVAPFMPKLGFYNIIPVPAFLLAAFGLYFVYKNKKWILLSEFILGAIFWFIYSFTVYRFFVEYGRVAVFTSIITVIISGFGLKQIEEYFKIKSEDKRIKILKLAETTVLLVFLLLVPIYTRGENWRRLVAIDSARGLVAYPKSPANNYLTQDDLRIFKDIKNKRFLSVPWKGTVIGVATDNYPVLTKEGTISIFIGTKDILNNFLEADCSGKKDIAEEFLLDYVYIDEFSCSGFEKMAESNENFVLYKVKND